MTDNMEIQAVPYIDIQVGGGPVGTLPSTAEKDSTTRWPCLTMWSRG
jgi:hypothetical protein